MGGLDREIRPWVESGTDPDLSPAPILLVLKGKEVFVGLRDFFRCGDPVCSALRTSFSGEGLERFLQDTDELVREEGESLLAAILEKEGRPESPPLSMAFVLVLSDPRNPRVGVKDRWMLLTRRDGKKRREPGQKSTCDREGRPVVS